MSENDIFNHLISVEKQAKDLVCEAEKEAEKQVQKARAEAHRRYQERIKEKLKDLQGREAQERERIEGERRRRIAEFEESLSGQALHPQAFIRKLWELIGAL